MRAHWRQTGSLRGRAIRSGLAEAKAAVGAVSREDFSQNLDLSRKDEIGELVQALNSMTANSRATAQIADAIADGDLSVEPKPLSDKDALGIALRRMTEKLRAVVSEALTAAGSVSTGSGQTLRGKPGRLRRRQRTSRFRRGGVVIHGADGRDIKQNAKNAAETEKAARQSSADAKASGEAVNPRC